MTWREIHAQIQQELKSQRVTVADYPPGYPHATTAQLRSMEMDIRSWLDGWILACYTQKHFEPIGKYEGYWYALRLEWARDWVTPLVESPLADQEGFEDWPGHLLVDCWHAYGALVSSAPPPAPAGLLPTDLNGPKPPSTNTDSDSFAA